MAISKTDIQIAIITGFVFAVASLIARKAAQNLAGKTR